MDLRTGKIYETRAAALAAGVPSSDVVEVLSPIEERLRKGLPVVRFTKGSFKSFIRNADGELVKL